MERKTFIKTCGFACLGGLIGNTLLSGCASTKIVDATIIDTNLVLPEAAFREAQNSYKNYVVVENARLKYPICVFRKSATEYTAVYMYCTHQGAQLQVFGDRLECPAHGSQFSNSGEVKTGPAETALRTFPIIIQNNQLYISLLK